MRPGQPVQTDGIGGQGLFPARLRARKSPARLSRLATLPPVLCDGPSAMRTWLPMCHAIRNTQSNHDDSDVPRQRQVRRCQYAGRGRSPNLHCRWILSIDTAMTECQSTSSHYPETTSQDMMAWRPWLRHSTYAFSSLASCRAEEANGDCLAASCPPGNSTQTCRTHA